jgi:glycerophosphoryl diester phosphodiesterase
MNRVSFAFSIGASALFWITTAASAQLRFPDAIKTDKPAVHTLWSEAGQVVHTVANEFTVEWWQFVTSAQDAQPVFALGATEVGLRPIPKSMVKDPPRAVLSAGDTVRTKVFAYPGKWHYFALVVKDNEARLLVNGFPDGDPFPANSLSGKMSFRLDAQPKTQVREVTVFDHALPADRILAHFKSFLPPQPVLIAGHRGDNRGSPENTNVSYVNAIQMGVPIVEMDLRLTQDNVLVLLHDATVNRTSNGKGKIVEMTLADARKLDFGSWKDPRYKGEPIPTVQAICDTCRGKAIMMLDLKCPGLGKPLAELKEQTHFASDQWILAPWEDEEGVALRRYLPDVPMIRLTGKVPIDHFDDAYFAKMKRIGFSGFSIAYPITPQTFIDAAHKNGMKIWVWTINDASDIAGAVLAGVDGIVTDDVPNTTKLVMDLTGSLAKP